MARQLMLAACFLAGLAAVPARAVCVIDAAGEIVNPFDAGCGDVMLTYTNTDNTGNNVALGFPVPIPVASLTPVDGFRSYASLFARHQELLTLHDEVTGQVVGQTVTGRDIWAYAVGDADAVTADGIAEGAALVNGGIHAREWQTPEAVTALFETLVARKADGGLGQYLVENFSTVVVPVNNVDGFLTTQRYPDRSTATRDQPREGRMRRKNLRNPVSQGAIDDDIATVSDNFWGVDLNRNSAQGFGLFGRSSASPTSLVFRATPASEPELAALVNAATLAPAARLRLFSDTHSFGQVYFAPTTTNDRRNAVSAALGDRMRAASLRGYQYAPDPPNTPGIGTTADNFAFAFEIPAWTLELEPANGGQDYGGVATHGHSGFVLPDREVARMRDDVTRMYLLGFYRQSGPPVPLAAQIRDTQSSEVVYEASWQATSATARTLAVAANRALVPGRVYRLWIAFSKPMRVRDGSGAVVPYRGQSTGAAVGTVTLEIPSLTGQDVALGANATWLATAGGAPNGYLRYADDAFAVDFTLPAALGVNASTPAVLALNVLDLSQMALDSDPATAVDWGSGHWVRYENVLGAQGDLGGVNCSFRPFVAPQADAAAPATTTACRSATPPPPPPPPPSGGGGGGGGGLQFATLVLLALSLAVARAFTRTSPRAGS